jgi:hypothetical protein
VYTTADVYVHKQRLASVNRILDAIATFLGSEPGTALPVGFPNVSQPLQGYNLK